MGVARHSQLCPDMPRFTKGEFGCCQGGMAIIEVIQQVNDFFFRHLFEILVLVLQKSSIFLHAIVFLHVIMSLIKMVSLTLWARRKMAEPAKKKQRWIFGMFKMVANTNEPSSTNSTLFLKNTSDSSKVKNRTDLEVNSIFEINTVV